MPQWPGRALRLARPGRGIFRLLQRDLNVLRSRPFLGFHAAGPFSPALRHRGDPDTIHTMSSVAGQEPTLTRSQTCVAE